MTRDQLTSPLQGVLGWLVGLVAGLMLIQLVELPTVWALPAIPLSALFGSYVALLFTAPPLPEREVRIVRGTRIVPVRTDPGKAMKKAIRQNQVCLAGNLLPVKAEVRSMLLLGASGTGKSVAITALMHTIFARGDRAIVADPDGAAMSLFWKEGDTILNPLDKRSVRWDLLAEISKPSDYKDLSESILPFTGDARIDEWRTHSQAIFAACLQTWDEGKLGTSDEFLTTMARSGESKIKLLCQGTPAAGYFAEGGEKMLSSIMNTLRPSLTDLETLVGGQGELFSLRRWMREGKGRLWIPYGADQIAVLRGPVSCWMRLGVFELLSMPTSDTRRMWFFLDELDALGRIQGLKDAMVRTRKKGGCIVAGIQSIAQVRAVYGDAEAQTIVEQFGTQLALKCGASEGGGTARFASELIGEREIERTETSNAFNRGQSGPNITLSNRMHVERAVMPAEITQLPDLFGYLRVSGRSEWMKVAFQPIELEVSTSPSEPIDPEKGIGSAELNEGDAEGSSQTATPPLMSAEGFPRMSFPFSAGRVFDLTAELYGREHPQRPPAPGMEGDHDELVKQQDAYVNGWTNVVWPDFRRWWTGAPEEDRYRKAMAALSAVGLELAGFDAIPEEVWERTRELQPAGGDQPFLNVA
jgi:Type IV secretion-system coupling protein DNA-binding domain